MTTYRYYCLRRPPAPGAIPRGACKIESFGDRVGILEIGGREAWGYAEYPNPLDASVVEEYEMEESRYEPRQSHRPRQGAQEAEVRQDCR